MKDSEVISRANQIISEIYSLLRDRFLRELIDLPIEKVVNEFDRSVPAEVTPVQFHEIIAAFVQLLYAQGLRLPLRLERDQAPCGSDPSSGTPGTPRTPAQDTAPASPMCVGGGRMALSAVLASPRRDLESPRAAEAPSLCPGGQAGRDRLASSAGDRQDRGAPYRVLSATPGGAILFEWSLAAGIAGFILADMATDSLCDGVLQSGFGQTPR